MNRKVQLWKVVEDEMKEDYHSFWRKVKLPSMRSPNNMNECTFEELKKGLEKAMGPTQGVVLEPDTDENEDVSDPLEEDFKVFEPQDNFSSQGHHRQEGQYPRAKMC